MPKKSAGLLVFHWRDGRLRVLLVHPGGPFWSKRDDGAWSIPKGEFEDPDSGLDEAKREFREELGKQPPAGPYRELAPVRQSSAKTVYAWAVEGAMDVSEIRSNLFSMEWPPKSGRMAEFPEVDKAEWFTVEEASKKIVKGQRALLEQLLSFNSVDEA